MLIEIIEDSFLDTLKTLPFLFAVYLLLEYLEHRAGDKTLAAVKKSGKYAPAAGALAGLLPQCGFSAAASNLYAAGVISRGTLIAVFLATSDEMLAVMLSHRAAGGVILRVLLSKLVIGMIAGFIIDLAERRLAGHRSRNMSELCRQENCKDEDGIVKAAVIHSLKIAGFLFLLGIAIGIAAELTGLESLNSTVFNRPVLGELLSGLIGLIPSCAASVLITRLYLEGCMSAGAMLSGLLTGAGVGLLVLFRINKNLKDNLLTVGILYFFGVVFGMLAEVIC